MYKEYDFWLKIKHLKPIRFYGYTNHVSCTILSQNHNYKTDEHDYLQSLGNELKQLIKDKGISWDNKVVIECEIIDCYAISNIFIGCYDGIWSVGLGRYGDDWIKPIEII